MNVREFVTRFVIKTEGQEHLDHVEHQLEKIKERLELFAAAEIAEKIFELGEKFAHLGEEIHVAALNAGVTVEEFQKLSTAAALNGVSSDEMSTGLARLSRNLYEAKQGSTSAQLAFQRVGINAAQMEGFKNGKDALLALAERFKNIHDPIQKAALAQELLGRGGVRLVGFLSKGSGAITEMGDKAEKLGTILSGHQIEALVELEHSFMRLFAVVRAFSATLASYFAPEIQEAIKSVLDFYQANRKMIDLNSRAFIGDLSYAFGFLWGVVSRVAQAFFDFAATHELLTRRVLEFVVALITLTGVIFSAQQALTVFKIASETLGIVLGPLAGGLKWLIAQFIGLFAAETTATLGTEGALAAMGALAVETDAAGAGMLAFLSPVLLVIAAVAALVLGVQALWKIFHDGGSFKDTWIGEAVYALGGLGSKALDLVGLGGSSQTAATASANLNSAQALGEVGTAGLAAIGGQQAQAGEAVGNYQINAPITVNVPQGTDHRAVGESVKQGVRDHLDRVQREAARSLRGAVAR